MSGRSPFKLFTATRAALAGPAAASLPATAGGLFGYELGTADLGLASAGYGARAQDASTVFANPAGMTRLEGNKFLGAGQLLWSNTRFSIGSGTSRRVYRQEHVTLKQDGLELDFDIIDTPGIATKIDYKDFLEFGLSEEEAKERAKEATKGIIEAIKWLDEVTGVLLVVDATQDPLTQANITIMGNLEARKIPFLIVANKIDLPESSTERIKAVFPQHEVVPISALQGENVEDLYQAMVNHF